MLPIKSSSVFQIFRQTIQSYGLLKRGDKVLIAFSGGPDSTALVFLFCELAPEWDLDLCCGHFNHKLRKSAGLDEAFVRETAERLNIPLYTGRTDVRAEARRSGLNLEEAARNLRYAFLKETARKQGAEKIATGHTRTDQAETFLIRLLRGSGRKGLAGIFPAVDGLIIRPIIRVERENILEYLRQRGIAYREDESNRDRRFLRNRIRLELIPELRQKYSAGIVAQLGRTAEIFQDEERFLENLASEKYASAREIDAGRICLRVERLRSFDRALARRVVRKFLQELKGDLRSVSFKDVEFLCRMKDGDIFSFRSGLSLIREGDRIFLKGVGSVLKYDLVWDGKCRLEIPPLDAVFEARTVNREGFRPEYDDSCRVLLDRDQLDFPLQVRNRRKGDRYRPLNAPGRRKLKEMMRERGILLSDRDRLPVFLSKEKIVWAAGLPVAEDFKITDSTKRVFVIEKDGNVSNP
ncbi:MAG: tRNA lysidine(34) synthetase TilS [Candidatus Aminicenantes bacterium]|nr:tRNA lysidine(34) synthetase TilS [Candidatus Aminicenantes bacterium]